MVPGLGNSHSQRAGGKTKCATNSVGKHSRRQPTDHSQRWSTARCVRGACEAFARVAMMEFEHEMRKQGVELTTELEYWAYVDDITIATTAELAPTVMGKLKEILERRGLELRRDKCTAYCPTPERADGVREEMTQFVKWTPNGLMILGKASDGEYRTEITTGDRRNHGPTTGRLQSARILADRIRQMCEADLECRRPPPLRGLDFWGLFGRPGMTDRMGFG